MLNRIVAIVSLGAAALLAGCATEPSLLTGEKAYYGYSWEQELALGKQSDAGIVQEMGLYRDDAIQEYVRSVGESLLAKSAFRQPDAPEIYRGTEFTFRVLDSTAVNAFALPGGYVYVTRGLLAHLNNEAQLAVVLGHEITHVEARHASQQALKQQWGQIGILAGAVIGDQVFENPNAGRQILDLGGNIFQLVALKYGRDAERESDLHGVEYAAKAGYAAGEGSAFFRSMKRITEKAGQSIPPWMSSHPDPGEREATVQQLAKRYEAGDRVGQEEFLRRIDGIVVGSDPRQGYVADGRFLHPELRIQFSFPKTWQVSNEPSAVYLVDSAKQAMMAFTLAPEADAATAARNFAAKSKMQVSRSAALGVNGKNGYTVEGLVQAEQQTFAVTNTFVEFNGKVASFMGYTVPAQAPAYQRIFSDLAATFDELKDARALEAQPSRIRLLRTTKVQAFKDYLPNRFPSGTDAQDWAIINQVELSDLIPEGTTLKLPQ